MRDPMKYADRGVHSADLWSFNKVIFADGKTGVSTRILVHLEGQEDKKHRGPCASLEFSIMISTSQTMDEIETEAIESAAAFLKRLGSVSLEDLKIAIAKGAEDALLKPQE
jgi:hypothetical protein